VSEGWVHPLRLYAEPSRVVVRPFHLSLQGHGARKSRLEALVDAIRELDAAQVSEELALVLRDFGSRHWQIEDVFDQRFNQVAWQLKLDPAGIPRETRRLIGGYFCHEYSYAAAAVMNPSVVRHPDQSGLKPDSVRFIMAQRTVGEGHISSIAFREGIVTADRELMLHPQPPFATAALLSAAEPRSGINFVRRHRDSPISGMVIFPVTEAQSNGLEDLRLVEFTHDDGSREWLGTYTAYSGHSIGSELLRTSDFDHFALEPITGRAAHNKGMALFPRKIGGGYTMLGRHDGKNIFLIRSLTFTRWDEGDLLLEPEFPWELVQIGNCGAPIELDEGWLVLIHGVGAMRKYSIGAVLLDKDDPSKVLGRTARPLVSAAEQDREGYVPNVVYTCGAIRVGEDTLFMPYGIADSSICFGFFSIRSILNLL
jgi:predicted GH43/DUF377 family glycosyl hydrolase